jgi:hypothetical protein
MGFIERDNAPFKQALQDWIQVYITDSWHVGAYFVNQQMNNCLHDGRDMPTPYQIYYSKEDEKTFEDMLKKVKMWMMIVKKMMKQTKRRKNRMNKKKRRRRRRGKKKEKKKRKKEEEKEKVRQKKWCNTQKCREDSSEFVLLHGRAVAEYKE